MYARLNLVKSRVYLCFSFFFCVCFKPLNEADVDLTSKVEREGGGKKNRENVITVALQRVPFSRFLVA